MVLQEWFIQDISMDTMDGPTKGHHERGHFPFVSPEDKTLDRLQTLGGHQDQYNIVNTVYHVDWHLMLLKQASLVGINRHDTRLLMNSLFFGWIHGHREGTSDFDASNGRAFY